MRELFLFFILLLTLIADAQQWENVSPETDLFTSSGCFINSNEGWLFSRHSTDYNYQLLHTADGAQHFDSIFALPYNRVCWNLQMLDTLTGYAMIDKISGSGNNFWKTIDSGHTWNDITDTSLFNTGGPLHDCNGFYFINNSTGYIGGIKSIYKTEDGGLSWLKLNTPSVIDSVHTNNYRINSIYFVNDKYGWAVCSMVMDNGFGLKTIDGGQNWTVCTPITMDLLDVDFSDTLKGGMVGNTSFFSVVIGTQDNFTSISYNYSVYSNPPWNQIPFAISYQNDSTIWISGFPAVLKKSTDRGATFIDYDTSFATNALNDCIFDIRFFGNTGYAFSYNFLLKMVDTLNTSRPEPGNFTTDIIIAPNPVTGKCRFMVRMIKPELTNIEIVSSTGVLVAKEEMFLDTGKNEVQLNVENLKSGLFILCLHNSSGLKHAKFIRQ